MIVRQAHDWFVTLLVTDDKPDYQYFSDVDTDVRHIGPRTDAIVRSERGRNSAARACVGTRSQRSYHSSNSYHASTWSCRHYLNSNHYSLEYRHALLVYPVDAHLVGHRAF